MTIPEATKHQDFVILSSPGAPSPRNAAERVFLTDAEKQLLKISFDAGFRYLPIELFQTEDNFFVFDARNVSFFAVDRVTFDILAILRDKNTPLSELVALLPQHSEQDVCQSHKELLELQDLHLLEHYAFTRVPAHDNSEFEQVLRESMAGFTVFITTRCNLGCSYCIYGGQYDQHEELSQTPMPWGTVENMMKFLKAHSVKSKKVRLDFFGGEPLLAFEAIKCGVEYLKSILDPGGPELDVTITSNGTVLTDAIIDFLLEHKVFLQFSVDGDKESHDQHRPFKNTGRGSFERIFGNLQRIYDRSPEYFGSHLRLKGVLTTEGVDQDDREFFDHPLILLLLREHHFSFLNLEPHFDLATDGDYFRRLNGLAEKLLPMEGLETESDIVKRLNIKQQFLYRHTFGKFFDAQAVNQVYFQGKDAVPFTKSCLTGYQEGAVSENGDISICLKSAKGKNFVIGNVNEGRWYYEKMRELNTLFHRDWSGCSSCYLQKICDLCYEKLNGVEGEFVAGRSKFCEFNRMKFKVIFDTMLRVFERNPKLWFYLQLTIEAKVKERLPACPDEELTRFASHDLITSPQMTD